jgi:hypothetical protein
LTLFWLLVSGLWSLVAGFEVSGTRFQPSRRPKKRPVKSKKKLCHFGVVSYESFRDSCFVFFKSEIRNPKSKIEGLASGFWPLVSGLLSLVSRFQVTDDRQRF